MDLTRRRGESGDGGMLRLSRYVHGRRYLSANSAALREVSI